MTTEDVGSTYAAAAPQPEKLRLGLLRLTEIKLVLYAPHI
jgi:hypothetical protein